MSEPFVTPPDPSDGPSPEPSSTPATPSAPKVRSRTRNIVEWTAVLVGALLIAGVIHVTSLQAFRIPSASMEPTLKVGDRVLVNKWSYRMHDVNRGDVVVFSRPPGLADKSVDDLIKRVIGLPGDAVSIDGGHVLINGEVLDEPYLAPNVTTQPSGSVKCPPDDPCVIPDGQVWVMGDNRTQSEDSRYFGPIDQSTIVGRAFVRLWPLGRLGGL